VKIIRSIPKMQEYARALKKQKRSIGLVPTMGALHAGHISLIRQARKDNAKVVVSIFVNPIQFGPQEDFKKYPRVFAQDAKICRHEGVDIIFYPSVKDMYKNNYRTYVFVEKLSQNLCGAFRPGHFQGVATAVNKLFNIAQPDRAYFGQKDAQQAVIIKKMAEDLNMPVEIKVMPTVRANNGLALSSRNAYLSEGARQDAALIYEALDLARSLIKKGDYKTADIIGAMQKLISKNKNIKIQYLLIVDLKDLKPIYRIKSGVLIAIAAFIGELRLIDNIVVDRKGRFISV